ncbi:MAG: response regulator [Halobacteriota archaeon]
MDTKVASKQIIILLVEDDEAHAKLIMRALDEVNVPKRIFWVNDGEAALDFLFHHGIYRDEKESPRPDLIVLDLRLPKRDGHEVLREIKKSRELRNIPVVVITASQKEEDEMLAYSNYVNSYLLKPSDFHEFAGMIYEAGSYWLIWNQHERYGM